MGGKRRENAGRAKKSVAGSRKRESGEPIPVVLDQNTAMYSLHLYDGVGETFDIEITPGGKIKLQVAGLLANSIFQGDLIIERGEFPAVVSRYQWLPDVSDRGPTSGRGKSPLVGKHVGRLWLLRTNHGRRLTDVFRRAKYVSVDLSQPGRVGSALGHVWSGGGATTQHR